MSDDLNNIMYNKFMNIMKKGEEKNQIYLCWIFIDRLAKLDWPQDNEIHVYKTP